MCEMKVGWAGMLFHFHVIDLVIYSEAEADELQAI